MMNVLQIKAIEINDKEIFLKACAQTRLMFTSRLVELNAVYIRCSIYELLKIFATPYSQVTILKH